MTYFSLVRLGEKKAEEAGLEKTAVKSLLLFASHKTPTEIYTDIHEEVPEEVKELFLKCLDEYVVKKRPSQYIVGFAYFYGYKIRVDSSVLIPRWETEELTEHILMYYDMYFKGEKVNVLDLGTGSGAIAISLAKEEPNMTLTATDISLAALKTASLSAIDNEAQVKFLAGSWFDAVPKDAVYDIIVSNPPYLTTEEYVEPIVKDNEPNVALYGGSDGLDFYRVILKNAKAHLSPNKYMMAFEHGYDKTEQLNEIIKLYFEEAEIINLKDSAGRDRMTFIIKK